MACRLVAISVLWLSCIQRQKFEPFWLCELGEIDRTECFHPDWLGSMLRSRSCFRTCILHVVNDYQPVIQLFCLKISDSKIVCLNRRGCKQTHFFSLNICLITFANSVRNNFSDCLTSNSLNFWMGTQEILRERMQM